MTNEAISALGAYHLSYAVQQYKKNSEPVKTEEEIKDEEIKIKPPLPIGCGNKVDLLI